MMFMPFNSNTTGATSGTGNVHSSGAHEFTPGFSFVDCVVQSLVFYVVLRRPLFVFCSFSNILTTSVPKVIPETRCVH